MLFSNAGSKLGFDRLRMRVIGPESIGDYAAAVAYCQNVYTHKLKVKQTISKKSLYMVLEERGPEGYEIISCFGVVFPNENAKQFSEMYLPYDIEDYMKVVSPELNFNKNKMVELTALCSTSGDFTSRMMLICAPILAYKLGYDYALVTITEVIRDLVSLKCHWNMSPLVFSNSDYANINRDDWGRYYDFKPITCLVNLEDSFTSACNDKEDFLVRQCLNICAPINAFSKNCA
ncbi:thermostable hemolysin [Moritella yayanosii]|uniref:Thermostable hemolysin n=1 Tax=Moritella yayanosii TaxID=69539 RepID=A0A330LSH7_9GAMM|nr:thermostable hemolysin [Moritella yayanosii]SQD79790.1 protein of unknown function [Moritella yayanosii]